jgi:thiosulfate/3-mercaptopyruvate sulfurtransferase
MMDLNTMDKDIGSAHANCDLNSDLNSTTVSVAWLHQHLQDSQGIIIDCRFSLTDAEAGQQQYQSSHIPGAHYFDLNQDLSSPVKQHGGRHPLPNMAQLAEKLASVGVRSGGGGQSPSWVVVYDDSRFAYASRLWWLLRYMGHDCVAVLDGGWSSWLAAGYSVTSVLPIAQPREFVPQLRADWIVDIETVKRCKDLPEVALIDSRERERYQGEREPIDPIAGHIPGAVNYPWQEVTDAQGYLRPETEQQHRWAELSASREILVYCGSGVTACVNLLSLTTAGIHTGKLYVGSWSDWCSYLEQPQTSG